MGVLDKLQARQNRYSQQPVPSLHGNQFNWEGFTPYGSEKEKDSLLTLLHPEVQMQQGLGMLQNDTLNGANYIKESIRKTAGDLSFAEFKQLNDYNNERIEELRNEISGYEQQQPLMMVEAIHSGSLPVIGSTVQGTARVLNAFTDTDAPTFRRVLEGILGGVQAGIGVLPEMAMLSTATPFAKTIAKPIGKAVAGETGEKIADIGTDLAGAGALGKQVVGGMLASIGASKTANAVLQGFDLDDKDKELITELAGQVGFVGGLVAGKKMVREKFNIKENETKPVEGLTQESLPTELVRPSFEIKPNEPKKVEGLTQEMSLRELFENSEGKTRLEVLSDAKDQLSKKNNLTETEARELDYIDRSIKVEEAGNGFKEIQKPIKQVKGGAEKPVEKQVKGDKTKYEQAIKLEKSSYGLKPKNAIDRLIKAEALYKELGLTENIKEVQRLIETHNNRLQPKVNSKAKAQEEPNPTIERLRNEAKAEINNTSAIRRMLGEKKSPEDIATALNVRLKDVVREQEYLNDVNTIKNAPLTMGFDIKTNNAYIRAGLYHFQNGLRDFKSWSNEMITSIGEKIKPALNRIWAGVKHQFRDRNPVEPANLNNQQLFALDKLILSIKEAGKVRKDTEKLYTQERRQRAGKLASAIERGKEGGEATVNEALGTLKGELPKADFDNVRGKFKQEEIDQLFNALWQSELRPFEKVNAVTGLGKLFGEGGGKIPTTSELALLEKVFGSELVKEVQGKRGVWEKTRANFLEAINIPRAILSSFDMSAPFRQGLVLTVSKPRQSIPAMGDMVKMFFNEKAFKELETDLATRKNVDLYEEAGLYLSGRKGEARTLAQREEVFMSKMADRIPILGIAIRASERAYLGYLNKMRADVFDNLASAFIKDGITPESNPKAFQDLASFINNATGRGKLGKYGERVSPLLNGVFFSPRNFAAKLTLLNPAYYAKLEKPVRIEAMKDMLTLVGAGTTVLSLASMIPGVKVETDPRSSDFGKIRVGNTRMDIWGGFQQPVRFFTQFMTGEYKSTRTGQVRELSNKKFPFETRWDLFARFFQQKFSPQASFVADQLRGEDLIGRELTLTDEVKQNLIPLYMQDMIEASEELGLGSVALGAPAIFGVGVQNYKVQSKTKANRSYSRNYNSRSYTR